MSQPALPRMRIVYFSSQPSIVVNPLYQGLEQLGQQVLLVVTTPGPRTRPTTAFKDVVENRPEGMDVLVTSHIDRLAPMLRGLEPDLIFVTGFPWRLPPDLISLPRLGAINVHPALLPKYRGPDPLFWQLENGEPEFGLTIHRMDPEFDSGPILVQRSSPIMPDDDIDRISMRLLTLGAPMIPEALALVASGELGRPQEGEESYAPLRSEQDRVLDWTRTAHQLDNRIRAWGYMGAVGEIDGQQWLVRRARPAGPGMWRGVAPGTVLDRSLEGILLQTGDGALLLEDAIPLTTED